MFKKYLFFIKIFLLMVAGTMLFLGSSKVMAIDIFGSTDGGKSLTEQIAGGAGYDTAVTETSLAVTVGRIIGVVLSIIGVIFFVLVFYAGYLWLTARGDEGQVEKAQGIIKMAVVGMVITFSAYTISYFVIRQIRGATGGQSKVGSSTSQPRSSSPTTPNPSSPLTPGATCTNVAKDGDETDVNCGGSCSPCTPGKSCLQNKDCDSNNCVSGICQNKVSVDACTNGVKDASETDVDCGGLACKACARGKACTADYDCEAGARCVGNVCQ